MLSKQGSFAILSAMMMVVLMVDCRPVAAGDSTLIPIDQIPKLPEFFDLVDYKQVFSEGTLLPDRVSWDTVSIRVGMSEATLAACLPDSIDVKDSTEARTREQQWQFLRGVLHSNNMSMHYYILAEIYYDKQLSGWFKTYEWHLVGVGTIRIHLHAARETGDYRVWLLQLVLDKVAPQSVKYIHPPDLVLARSGEPRLVWDVRTNRVTIDFEKQPE